jgi:hypothetical protein
MEHRDLSFYQQRGDGSVRRSSEEPSSRYIVSRQLFVAKASISRETNAISTPK